jgi:hypothetical protein
MSVGIGRVDGLIDDRLFAAVHESACGRFCCKSPLPLLPKIFLGC